MLLTPPSPPPLSPPPPNAMTKDSTGEATEEDKDIQAATTAIAGLNINGVIDLSAAGEKAEQ